MAGERILVVEDEPGVMAMTREVLESGDEAYEVTGASDPAAALDRIYADRPDLVLLDLNLGRRFDGLDVCRAVRANAQTADVPIIVLTGELLDDAETMLLDAGADDYLRKPRFTPRLLLSRVRAVLRRTSQETSEPLRHGPLTLDPGRREARLEGAPLGFTPTEFDILRRLLTDRDRALERHELLDRGGQPGEKAIDRTVDVHVLSMRRKLGRHDWLIETVFGVGYRLGTAPRPAHP